MPKMVLYIDYEPKQDGASRSRVIAATDVHKVEGAKNPWLDANILKTNDADLLAQVEVRNESDGSIKEPLDGLSLLAHEVGHTLAKLAGANASTKADNVRMKYGLLGELFGMIQPAKIAEEKEAWDIADKMGIPIDSKTKKLSIDSYEKTLE